MIVNKQNNKRMHHLSKSANYHVMFNLYTADNYCLFPIWFEFAAMNQCLRYPCSSIRLRFLMLHKLNNQIFTTETAHILLKVITFLVHIIADHLIEKYKLGFRFLHKYYIFLWFHYTLQPVIWYSH